MKRTNCAKINLALNVVKKLPNGYHELDMVNVCVNLKDSVSIKFNKSGKINVTSNNENLPTDDKNVVVKVIEKVKDQFKLDFGCDVYINKNIPLNSGLGGGSGNAAATLKILNKKFKLNMSQIQLINFIKSISSDAPFQLVEYPSRVKGIGDIVKLINSNFHGKVLIVKPFEGNSTEEVFNNLNLETCSHPNINKVEKALMENNYSLLGKHVGNSLLESAVKSCPKISETIDALKDLGFEIVSLSGSGTSVFAMSKNKKLFKLAKATLNKDKYELVGVYNIFNF